MPGSVNLMYIQLEIVPKIYSSSILINMLNILLIIMGSILLFLVYYNLTRSVESYAENRIVSFNDTLNNETKLTKKTLNKLLETNNLLGEYRKMKFFDSIMHNMSLINAFKILQEANKKTNQTIALYDICFKDNNPCNKYCVDIEPKFCKIRQN